MKNAHIDYKLMKKQLGLTNEDVAKIIGLTPNSVRNQTAKAKKAPAWAKGMIYVWNKLR